MNNQQAIYHLNEANRIQEELDSLSDDERFADDGIVKTVLRQRIKQEKDLYYQYSVNKIAKME